MKRTILYAEHVTAGARMAPFAGVDMPIQYEGILAEHEATRSRAALFDTCHMGEFHIWGESAGPDLERLLSCDVASLKVGRCRYGLMCNPHGGVVDDLILYRLGQTTYMMVVNAGTRTSDFLWLCQHCSIATKLEDRSVETAKIDLQGPDSVAILQKLLDEPIPPLKYFHFRYGQFHGEDVLVSRTGYTGEIGFELYCSTGMAPVVWQTCRKLGAALAGLGARDVLRLEMGYPLYGHELAADRNAASTGLDRAISGTKDFIGRDAVRHSNVTERLVGLRLAGRRTAREGAGVTDAAGRQVGTVTSGSFSPCLKCAIAMAYVREDVAAPGAQLILHAGAAKLPAVVVELPFVSDTTVRKPFEEFEKRIRNAGKPAQKGTTDGTE